MTTRAAGADGQTDGGQVSIVVQTRIRTEAAEAFVAWQAGTSLVVATFPGFIAQTLMPPSPPQQVDWVIVQRFTDEPSAIAWLDSPARRERLAGIAPLLVGSDDVHIVRDGSRGVMPAPVSAVISTRIRPGSEAQYRLWEQRIASAQTRAAGFQGYRFEPPIPGVQPDYLSILRFDTEEHLAAWMNSPERLALLKEAEAFTEEFHARTVRSGFDQWFPGGGAGGAAPVWKADMVVLLLLFPIVFLFGHYVMTPYLLDAARLPFPVALFLGNIVSILLLNLAVPRVSDRLAWWLRPAVASRKTDIAGAALLALVYAALIAAFTALMSYA